MALKKTWRWFGQKDSITLSDIKQIGIEGIVTALHHIPNGEIWPVDEIIKIKTEIEKHGMQWSVVESLPVSEGIKTKSHDWHRLISNYQQSLRNLGACGINTVCYNFMPVLDWARTSLKYYLPTGGEVMFFNLPVFVAFDAYILKRPDAEKDYPSDIVEKAKKAYANMSEEEKEELAYNIIVLTQGFINGSIGDSVTDFKQVFLDLISRYNDIDRDKYRQHLSDFLKEVVPVAEEVGIKLCIHPDDPPFPVLGLPRIVSTLDDLQWICNQYDSLNNGITFCTGSLSVHPDNNSVNIIQKLGSKIHFAHLRNNNFKEDGSFYESGHIEGKVNMYYIIKALILEQQRRIWEGRLDTRIPFRPDHGVKILDDFMKDANPGYPLIGRLKGLAEITGIEFAVEQELGICKPPMY